MRNFRRVGLAFLISALPLSLAASAHAETASIPAAKPPACKRDAFRLALDVGHTAKQPGATSARGAKEYDFNLALAKVIERKLTGAGFSKTALLVTDGPMYRGLAERVDKANRLRADLFLSIHHDSVPDSFLEKWKFEGEERTYSDRFKGHSLFISNDNPDRKASFQFAQLLGRQLRDRGLQYARQYTEKFMGHKRRIIVDAETGVYRYDQLIVLRTTHMPAVLLEAGSIIHRDEELAMATPERQALISAAVLDAVEAFCAERPPHDRTVAAEKPPARRR